MRITDKTTAIVHYPYGTTPSTYRARAVASMIPLWLGVWESTERPYHDADLHAHMHASRVGAYLATLPDPSSEVL